jgi:hypothetical protein
MRKVGCHAIVKRLRLCASGKGEVRPLRRSIPRHQGRGQSTGIRNQSCCIKATFLLRRHHSVRVSGETWVYAYRKEQGSLNDVDQERYSDSPEVGFCIATGEAGHIKCRAGSGLWSLLRIRWRSKKLDKTSRLVRINHRIFRSLRARERFSSVKCNPGRPQVSHFCKIWFWK